ncbi:MAG: hypothetical protein WC003_13915 [Terrimicrobiaceae bacterium]
MNKPTDNDLEGALWIWPEIGGGGLASNAATFAEYAQKAFEAFKNRSNPITSFQ